MALEQEGAHVLAKGAYGHCGTDCGEVLPLGHLGQEGVKDSNETANVRTLKFSSRRSLLSWRGQVWFDCATTTV